GKTGRKRHRCAEPRTSLPGFIRWLGEPAHRVRPDRTARVEPGDGVYMLTSVEEKVVEWLLLVESEPREPDNTLTRLHTPEDHHHLAIRQLKWAWITETERSESIRGVLGSRDGRALALPHHDLRQVAPAAVVESSQIGPQARRLQAAREGQPPD